MKITAIKTRQFLPPKDDLFSLMKESFSGVTIKEKSIVVVTSKIVSIWQGRCVKIEESIDKNILAEKEADQYAYVKSIFGNKSIITIKNNILISKAGIDESNANGYYILWPQTPFLCAKEICSFIKTEYRLKNVGVIISDSHSMPFRVGIMGIGIGYCGFSPLRDYRGSKDIFGREMKYSRTNVVDSLATAAVFEMGEGSEQTPLAIIEDAVNITFNETSENQTDEIAVNMQGDIYSPLLKSIQWKKGGENVK